MGMNYASLTLSYRKALERKLAGGKAWERGNCLRMLHIIYDFCINLSLVQFSMFPIWGEFKRNSVQRIVYCGSISSYESHYYVHTTVLYDNTSIGAEYNDQSLKLCVATRGSYAWMELAFSDKVLHHTVHLQLLVMRFIVNSQGRYSFRLLHKSFSRRQCRGCIL